MNILGIETSCDETACAVVTDGALVVSNIVWTQIPLHRPYGGVVPEIASRAHIEKIGEVVKAAINGAKEKGIEKIDAVAVTYGPGLSPALLVGLNAAKGLARALNVPLIPINHLEGHLHTPFLVDSPDEERILPQEAMPALGLAVSGGHTTWVKMATYGIYETIGQTLDDAAGEAFDKASKLLGLGYPGGPAIDKAAREYLGNDFIPFPKGRPREGVSALAGLEANLCVSFSGLKTALLRYVQANGAQDIPRIAASYQRAIVESLCDRTENALKTCAFKSLIVGGGVSLNGELRKALEKLASKRNIRLLTAKPKYCGDNAAMIASIAYYRTNAISPDSFNIDVAPSLDI